MKYKVTFVQSEIVTAVVDAAGEMSAIEDLLHLIQTGGYDCGEENKTFSKRETINYKVEEVKHEQQ